MRDIREGDRMNIKNRDGSRLTDLEVAWIDNDGEPVLSIPIAEFSRLRHLEADGWVVTAHTRERP